MGHNGSGPPDHWIKSQVSTTSDPNAQSSNQVLAFLNTNPISAAVTVVCSDGTFVFVGVYSKKSE